MVVVSSFNDGEASIDLLQQKKPHHLMREGHARERKGPVRASAKVRFEAVRSTDDKGHLASAKIPFLAQKVCELLRGHGFAECVEHNHGAFGRPLGTQRLVFFGSCGDGYGSRGQFAKRRKPLEELVLDGDVRLFFCLSHLEQSDVHSLTIPIILPYGYGSRRRFSPLPRGSNRSPV